MLNQLKFNQKQIQWILITIMMSQETGLTLGGFVTCTSCITRFFFVGKGTHEPKAQMARAYPGFISMKHLGVLLLPPGQDASASQGHPPAVSCRYPFRHLGEERQSGVKFLA